ncbi:MAG: hypothetical protein SFX18_15420 [Pirellulales bacterium]|nr:hypothetical protein [Pirellulales bacterium]
MLSACGDYLRQLSAEVGACWERFWFTPRNPGWLGMIRLLTGCVALYWYLGYAGNLIEWFGPTGIVTPELLNNWHGGRSYISLFAWSQDPNMLWGLYAAGLLCVAAMTVGWQANWTTPLATLFVISLLQRGPLYSGPGEDVLAFVLVYLCIGNSGATWSVERWLAKDAEHAKNSNGNVPDNRPIPASCCVWHHAQPTIRTNLAVRLLQVHFAMYCFAMALAQLGFENHWWSGIALWGLVTRVDSRWVDLTGIRDYPVLLNFWTHAVVIWELATALVWWPRLRPLLVALGVILWGSLAVAGGMIVWPAMMIIASLSFLED